MPDAEDVILLGISRTMVENIVGVLKPWLTAGMGSVKDLRSVTGRLSWMAGILARRRWTVNIFYAAKRSRRMALMRSEEQQAERIRGQKQDSF